MNDIDIKELVNVGQRTALLLGEITGSLDMIIKSAQLSSPNDEVPILELEILLSTITKRINSIYYEDKK